MLSKQLFDLDNWERVFAWRFRRSLSSFRPLLAGWLGF